MRGSYAVALGRQATLGRGGQRPRGFAAVVLAATLALGLIGLAIIQLTGQAGSASTAPVDQGKLKQAYGKLPLRFEANRGQTDAQVKFLSRGAGYSLFLTPKEAVLSLQRPAPEGSARNKSASSERAVVRMRMVGANPSPQLAGVGRLPGESNYMVGKDQSKWQTGVEGYRKVRYSSVYPGTDLVYYGRQGKLEYDFVLRPGADPSRIGLSFAGVKGMTVDRRGDLVLSTAAGKVRQRRPFVYQQHGAERRRIAGRYVLEGKDRVGFSLGRYDRTKALVIDPVLEYSSYLGGSGDDATTSDGSGIAVDLAGSVYITGPTSSADFPAAETSTIQNKNGGGRTDVFVAKLNPAGSGLEYSTYLGGSGAESGQGNDIAVAPSGSAYITGDTTSDDFPTKNALDTTLGDNDPKTLSSDAFVAKLDPTGSALVYSTYVGGTQSFDIARGIALDDAGSAYVTGDSQGIADFPTTEGAFDRTDLGGGAVFVTKFTPDGSRLAYSTYLGGRTGSAPVGPFATGGQSSFAIAVDRVGSAYVTGRTISVDFPTTDNAFARKGSFQPGVLGHAAFVTKFSADGSRLEYSTYLDGLQHDGGGAIAVDEHGGAYVAGNTNSANFPTTEGAFDRVPGTSPTAFDAFVTKFDTTASGEASLVYSTFLGGLGDEGRGREHDVAVDGSGSAYVTGRTLSADFPTKDALDTELSGSQDAYVTKLTPDGSALVFSTYLGGSLLDHGIGIAVDAARNPYVTGSTQSPDFPTEKALDSSLSGRSDAFISKLSGPSPPPSVSISDAAVAEGKKGQTTSATFTVSLSEPSPMQVSVDFQTADDSAKAPDDYASRSGSLTFGAGDQSKTITVPVNGDNSVEPDERFLVKLSNPMLASIGDGTGTGTINNDDGRKPPR